jgi:DNA primase
MAGRIPQAFIDEVLARTDIVAVVGDVVRLKKSGRGFIGLCPFHQEKTASFSVNPDGGFYYCFGCHASGTAISFLMEHERLDFPDAIADLASRVGLTVPSEGEPSPAAREAAGLAQRLYACNHAAMEWFRQCLKSHGERAHAVDYLKRRGVTGTLARDFALGFAPAGWEQLARALAATNEARLELVEAGLLIKREDGGCYDRFRERVMFPIRDARGRVIGFGGRIIGEGEPKYLNSPETPVFHKGRELYGLYEARRAGASDSWLLVEGYMDVIALAQHGVRHVVAALGTASTTDHLSRLFRQGSEVVCCFDGDNAGRRAAWRALENALPLLGEKGYLSFLFLPAGDDPDSLVRREGAEVFSDPRRRVPLSDFLFEHLATGLDPARVDEHRAKLVDLARPLLAQIPAGAYRRVLYDRLAQITRLDLPEARVQAGAVEPTATSAQPGRPRRPASGIPSGQRIRPSLCRRLAKLVLSQPPLAMEFDGPGECLDSDDPWAELLAEIVTRLADAGPEARAVDLLGQIEQVEHRAAVARLMEEEFIAPAEGLEAEFRAGLARLRQRLMQQRERAQRRGQLSATARADLDPPLPQAPGERD